MAECPAAEHDFLPPIVQYAVVRNWFVTRTSSSCTSICRKCGHSVTNIMNMKQQT